MYRYYAGITDVEVYIDNKPKRTAEINARMTNLSVTPVIGRDLAGTVRYAAIH